MKKIKLFLGAYINSPNAQNINCLALAEFLDKSKFDIYTMERNKGNINIDYLRDSCNIKKYNNKLKFTKVWKYIFALYKCDVLYLPKQEKLKVIAVVNKLIFRKKIFVTIEGIFDDYAVSVCNKRDKDGLKKWLKRINLINNLYSISAFCKIFNANKISLLTKQKILPLGVDIRKFQTKTLTKKPLNNIIFIGNDMIRKGIYEYLELAKLFPNLIFHIVGTSADIDCVKIKEEHSNIKVHGSLNPDELNRLLQDMDLHILPSKSEGFPKVILETASVGVCSLVYGHYGADEYITHNNNGFIAYDFMALKQILGEVQVNEQLLFNCSKNAIAIASKFDWKNIIKEWEAEIIKLNSERCFNV